MKFERRMNKLLENFPNEIFAIAIGKNKMA